MSSSSGAAAAPPPLPPAYVHAYSGDTLRNVAIAFTVVEVIFVALRFISKELGAAKKGIDDILILLALVCCVALNAVGLIGINYGKVGYHIAVVAETDPMALVSWAKVLVATPIIYSFACAFSKLVLLTLYLRIFSERRMRIATYVLMGIVSALCFANVVTAGVQCIPLAKLWDQSLPGTCINIAAYYRYGTLINILVDALMLVLPLPAVWNLHTTNRVKIGLTVTFLTGSTGLVTAIIRTVAFFRNNPLDDGTWTSVTLLTWAIIEPGTYLMAACLPCYRPLVNLIVTGDPKQSSRRGGASGGGTGGSYPNKGSFPGGSNSRKAQQLRSFDDYDMEMEGGSTPSSRGGVSQTWKIEGTEDKKSLVRIGGRRV